MISRTLKKIERCIDDDIGFTFERASLAAKYTHFQLSSRFHLFSVNEELTELESFRVYLKGFFHIFIIYLNLTRGDELVSRIESRSVEDFIRFEYETIVVRFRGGIARRRLKWRFFVLCFLTQTTIAPNVYRC